MVESAGSRALALTVIPAFLPDRGTSNASLEKDHDDLRRNFHLVPIADVKYVSDTKDVPQGARHFKGKNVMLMLEMVC